MTERDLPDEALRDVEPGQPEPTPNATWDADGPEGDIEEADF